MAIKIMLTLLTLLALAKTAGAERIDVGVSPPRIIAEHLLPGSHLERVILLSKSGNTDLEVDIIIDNPWIRVDTTTNFVFRESSVPLTFSIDVPHDADYGYYEDTVQVKLNPTVKSGISTEIIFPLSFKLNVTGVEHREYSLGVIRIPDVEEGLPIRILLTFENKGNVPAAPGKVEVEILDKFRKMSLQKTIHTSLRPVAPFTREKIVVDILHNLPPEQYSAHITVDAVKEDYVMFDVKEGNPSLFKSIRLLLQRIILGEII